MAAPDHSQGQSAKNLIGQVVSALVAENGLLRDDSIRIRRLTSEAANTLRQNFKEIDEVLKKLNRESGADHSLQFQNAFREIISTLQYEDIISQVIGHQLERSEITLSILLQIEEYLENPEETDSYEQMLGRLGTQIDSHLSRLPASESVDQQSLVVGETELFQETHRDRKDN